MPMRMEGSMRTCAEVRSAMLGDVALVDATLCLTLPEIGVVVRSNTPALLAELRHYFRHLVVTRNDDAGTVPMIEVIAIDRPPLEWALPWQDWLREAGKQGKKDAVVDIAGGRLIRKVRTGMLFLQSLDYAIAAGPCLTNSNQVINFINNQYMTLLQQRGWMICHAAALSQGEKSIAIAGFSGGGKSTAMLHLMADDRLNYITNDRLFIRAATDGVEVRGIPKLPRVNPGTLLHNPRLRPLLAPGRIAELQALPMAELWQLEQKYDVDIASWYGGDRFSSQPNLTHFIVLNWSHGRSPEAQQPTTMERVDIDARPELLDAIMKSSGPFYQHADGTFCTDHIQLPRQSYLAILRQVQMFEVRGKVDFSYLQGAVVQRFVTTKHPTKKWL
ncbi:MAG: HprK-related kinase B [Mariprofundales bacterium]|nr:HprK-related kinase B [Mariprofundales bacterium]